MATQNWFDIVSGFRRVEKAPIRQRRTAFEVDFALWKDMIEEPSKYGDDIIEWLALNESLSRGPGRWRLGAYWSEIEVAKEAEETALQMPWRKAFTPIAKKAADECMRRWVMRDVNAFIKRRRDALVTIQSAVRGHQARGKYSWTDCCMCLSHRICPLATDVGMMCRGCAAQGPYDDETGPIADPWSEFRGDYVDLAA